MPQSPKNQNENPVYGIPAPPPHMEDRKKSPGWPGETPDPGQFVTDSQYEADVVVVGAGHAGTQCALAAAEGGASVIVIDKQPNYDKIRWSGEQIGTFNSRFGIEKGLGPYDTMEIIKEFCRCGAYRVNQRLISMYVRNSGEMLDHMVGLVSPEDDILDDDQCNFQTAYGSPRYPVVCGGHKTWAGTLQFRGSLITERGGQIPVNGNSRLAEFERYASDRSVELGARWFMGESAAVLTQSGQRVTGVITKNSLTGAHTLFKARRAVCVTTGNGSDYGHKMCVWAGGLMEDNIRDAVWAPDTARSFGMNSFVLFNRNGERFCDESNPYNTAPQVYRQPRGLISCVFDSQWMKYLEASGIHHTMTDFGMPEYLEQVAEDMSHVLEHGKNGYGVRSVAASERELHPVWGAETLEELAEIIGYEGQARQSFLSSVARYNHMCYQGFDEDFGRDEKLLIPIDKPPYFAGMALNTRAKQGDSMCPAGLMTDYNMNVVNDDGEPIPGLYVAGNTLGDRYGLYYPTPCGGNMIGMAMTHGRCLGKLLTGQNVLR